MLRHRVTAGHVTVETAVPGGRAFIDVPRGELVPLDVPQEQIDHELALGQIEPIEVEELEPSNEDDDTDDTPPAVVVPEGMSVATTQEWVGEDIERARAALAAEEARGEFARATLVDRLGKQLAAAAPASGEAGGGADSGAGA